MRRVVLVLAAMALAMLLASGVAWAVTKIGTNGPDTLRGTTKSDNLVGRAATTYSLVMLATTTCWAGWARTYFLAAILNAANPPAVTNPWWAVVATMQLSAAKAPTT
jgi:hypothetical protein